MVAQEKNGSVSVKATWKILIKQKGKDCRLKWRVVLIM